MVKNQEREKRLNEISQKVNFIVKAVGNDSVIRKENSVCEVEEKGIPIRNILPSPLTVAKYFGLRIEYREMPEEIPSYLKREKLTIYISNWYIKDRYVTSKLVAHELGHFFIDDSLISAMNNDSLNDFLPAEVIKEYDANVFAILLMPQILGKKQKNWKDYSPELLNRIIYHELIQKDS